MVQYTPATARYWKTSTGKSCPEGEVVLTEGACRDAAVELGMKYQGPYTHTTYPAGCFYYEESYGLLYFNSQTNPLETNPSNLYGSVCTKGIIT